MPYKTLMQHEKNFYLVLAETIQQKNWIDFLSEMSLNGLGQMIIPYSYKYLINQPITRSRGNNFFQLLLVLNFLFSGLGLNKWPNCVCDDVYNRLFKQVEF